VPPITGKATDLEQTMANGPLADSLKEWQAGRSAALTYENARRSLAKAQSTQSRDR